LRELDIKISKKPIRNQDGASGVYEMLPGIDVTILHLLSVLKKWIPALIIQGIT